MTLALTIAADDPTPPFEQLRRQLEVAIVSGQLAEGTKLPTVRQLARDLGVAPGTIMRTYKELDDAGLIVSRRGGGSRVATGQAASTAPDWDQRAADFVSGLRRDGADDATISALVAQALNH